MTDDKPVRFTVPKYAETPKFQSAMADAVEKAMREDLDQKEAWLRVQLAALGITPGEMARDYYLEQTLPEVASTGLEGDHYVTRTHYTMRLVKRPPFVDEGAGI